MGVNDVLTALHVVYNSARSGWATRVTVTPGTDTQPYSAPYGSFTGARLDGRTANWDSNGDQLLSYSEVQYDLAVKTVASQVPKTAAGDLDLSFLTSGILRFS